MQNRRGQTSLYCYGWSSDLNLIIRSVTYASQNVSLILYHTQIIYDQSKTKDLLFLGSRVKISYSLQSVRFFLHLLKDPSPLFTQGFVIPHFDGPYKPYVHPELQTPPNVLNLYLFSPIFSLYSTESPKTETTYYHGIPYILLSVKTPFTFK